MGLFGLFKTTEEKLSDAVCGKAVALVKEIGASTSSLRGKYGNRIDVIASVYGAALVAHASGIIHERTEGKYPNYFAFLARDLDALYEMVKACIAKAKEWNYDYDKNYYVNSHNMCMEWARETVALNGFDSSDVARLMQIFDHYMHMMGNFAKELLESMNLW